MNYAFIAMVIIVATVSTAARLVIKLFEFYSTNLQVVVGVVAN